MPRSQPPGSDPRRAEDANPARDGPRCLKPPGDLVFECHLGATPQAVRDTLARVVPNLTGTGLSRCGTGMVELVLAEALNNIVEHAYAGETQGLILLRVTRDGHWLWVYLCDQGLPLPGDSVPPPRAARLDVPRADLPEGGFGWYLIHRLAHRLAHIRRGKNNHLAIGLDLDTLE